MRKVAASVTRDNLLDQSDFGHCHGLECARLDSFGRRTSMIGQVKVCSRQVLDRLKALIKLAGGDDFINDLGRNRLAGFVVPRKHVEDFGRAHPVFHDLRRELDEVTRYVCPRERLVGHVRHHAVQCVTELMEERLCFGQAQQ